MIDLLAVLGYVICSFAVAALVAFLLTRKTVQSAPPEVGSIIRLRSVGGVYRSKLVGVEQGVWRISCPIARSHYVPMRAGEPVTVEAPVTGGVYLFKTEIAGRDRETHELMLEPPPILRKSDRRNEARAPKAGEATIEGESAALVDLSRLGARILTDRPCHIGERVRLELEDSMVYAWVLDFAPTKIGEPYRECVRLRFEEALA